MGRPLTRGAIETELGTETQCARCRDFWPADPEFFYFSGGRPHSWCKACYFASGCFQEKKARFLEQQRAETLARRGLVVPAKPTPVTPAQIPLPAEIAAIPGSWGRMLVQLHQGVGASR